MDSIEHFFSGQALEVKGANGVFHRHALLTAGLGLARTSNGRDGTGSLVDETLANNWMGIFCYLAIFDQLAICFGADRSTGNQQRYVAFLVQHGVPEGESKAIYALRCGLVHEFGLSNKHKTDPELQRVFNVHADKASPLVRDPKTPWNGDYGQIGPDNITFLNFLKLADLAESIISGLKEKADKGTLKLEMDRGEFETRFFMMVGPL